MLEEQVAKSALYSLSRAIVGACEQNEELFKGTVLEHLSHLAQEKVLASPVDSSTATAHAVAAAIQSRLDTPVQVVAIDYSTESVWIWARIPGKTPPDMKRSLFDIACIASGVPNARWIKIGIHDIEDLSGTNGEGPIGIAYILISASCVSEAVAGGGATFAFWDDVRSFVIEPGTDNTDGQHWIETDFRRYMEGL